MGAAVGHSGRLTAADVLVALATAAPIDAQALAVVVAHPDDEVIGAGAHLPSLANATVVHVTDGAPRSMHDAHAAGYETRHDYARARSREAEASLALAGIPPGHVLALGVADQEASLRMAELTFRLARLIADRAIHVVLTHAYEGGHPDHDATAFAVHHAAGLIADAGGTEPAILEMAGYHAGPQGLVTHCFVPGGDPGQTAELDPAAQALKRQMLACHVSQLRTLAQFGVEVERFRLAPRYDFAAPPHPGRLWYEHFDWGMTGARWRALAGEALAELGIAHRCWTA
jgi:N-acetylglucosamine malate deacetylase 2